MYDQQARQACTAVASQILLVALSDVAAAGRRVSCRGSSGGPATHASSVVPSVVSTETQASTGASDLQRACDAVAQHAMSLYRLCRRPGSAAIHIVSSGSSSGGGAASLVEEAAYCVCAAIMALEPRLWVSLSWRAHALRPRRPSLLFVAPVTASPVVVRDVERFFGRSRHLLRATAIPPAATHASTVSAAAASAAAAAAPLSSASVPAPRTTTTTTMTTAAAAAPAAHAAGLSARQAEAVAACYFSLSMSPAERRSRCDVLEVRREDEGDTRRTAAADAAAAVTGARPSAVLAKGGRRGSGRGAPGALAGGDEQGRRAGLVGVAGGGQVAAAATAVMAGAGDPERRRKTRSTASLLAASALFSDGMAAWGQRPSVADGASAVAPVTWDARRLDGDWPSSDASSAGSTQSRGPSPDRDRSSGGGGGAGAATTATTTAAVANAAAAADDVLTRLYAAALAADEEEEEGTAVDEAPPHEGRRGTDAGTRTSTSAAAAPSGLLSGGRLSLVALAADVLHTRDALHWARLRAAVRNPLLLRLAPSLPFAAVVHPPPLPTLSPPPLLRLLQSTPASVVTGGALWTRLLICGAWLHVYADSLVEDGAGGAWQRVLPSPAVQAVVSFCVAVVREAREVSAGVAATTTTRGGRGDVGGGVCCPVCDSLVKEQLPVLQWTMVRGDRAALAAQVRAVLAGSTADGGDDEAAETTAAALTEDLTREERGRRYATPLLRGSHAAPLRISALQQRWVAYIMGSGAGTPTGAVAERGEADSPAVVEAEGLWAALAQRVAAAVDVCAFITAHPSAGDPPAAGLMGRGGGGRLKRRRASHGQGDPDEDEAPLPQSGSRHAAEAAEEWGRLLARCGWVNAAPPTSGVTPSTCAAWAASLFLPSSTPTAQQAATLHRRLSRYSLADVVRKLVLGRGGSVERYAWLLFGEAHLAEASTRATPPSSPPPPPRAASLSLLDDAAPGAEADAPLPSVPVVPPSTPPSHPPRPHTCTGLPPTPPRAATGRGTPPSTPLMTSPPTQPPRQAAAATPTAECCGPAPRERRRAQQAALYALLGFRPRLPALREEDAVLECAACFSLFHQRCVAPAQREMMGEAFLCHTCRLRWARPYVREGGGLVYQTAEPPPTPPR
ncbi:hypothetical protein NESM_000210400 [Novymonas esmeraldas]|uniref:Zinc finger PHD-type domain-containing protein n=1 Tax=Novymonas esmeraldas TaxID=1808958 RepID=A0AAW0F5E5_9TRYP